MPDQIGVGSPPMSLPLTIDIGCGPNKQEGAYGVDCHPFSGVDHVFDFEGSEWPLPSNHFKKVHCAHVIEHILDTRHFLRQIHRISVDGAEVYFETPHFSSIDSWSDPTHVLHLSSRWHQPLLSGGYLSRVVGEFQLIRRELDFRNAFGDHLAKLAIKLFGLAAYERYYCSLFPAQNVRTWLRVKK